tara:strand:+ start:1936 stop:3324 length:1389 start_codon:yes stop_codon:yes gene_type:complete
MKNLVLDPWQVRIVNHLVYNEEAFLMVGMGLGKTAAMLSAFKDLLDMGETRGALVVAPMNVATIQWPLEIEAWEQFSDIRFRIVRGKDCILEMFDSRPGSSDLWITNFEQLTSISDISELKRFKKKPLPFDMVIWDETTKAKNHSSVRINRFRRTIRNRLQKHWGGTGTPMPNSELELFAQCRLLDNGKALGTGVTRFKSAFFHNVGFGRFPKLEIKEGARGSILDRISDLALVMRTQDYIDLPELHVIDISVPLDKDTKDLYDELEKNLFLQLDDVEGSPAVVAQTAAVLVNKLLQMTSGAVFRDDGEIERFHDHKLIAIKKLLKKVNCNTIVCVSYVHDKKRLSKELPGAVEWTRKDAREIVERWNRGEIKTLVVNPISVGHGLNMQKGGHTIIWYTCPWSNEVYQQTPCRIWRRGQENDVEMYRLICPDTVDEAVVAGLKRKEGSQQALLKALTQYRKV